MSTEFPAKNKGPGKDGHSEKPNDTSRTEDWLPELDSLLTSRQVGDGFALLDDTEPLWAALDFRHRSRSGFLLTLAQWVDVGYRDALFLRGMLNLLSNEARLELNVVDYVRLHLAEAFYMLAVDRTSEAINTLETILRLDQNLLDPEMKLLAHLWKARAHRKHADYQTASKDILASLEVASTLPSAAVVRAVLQVQRGWIIFQCGDAAGALKVFDEAEAVLRHTDHWIAMGNIASARGRIVRRNGDYARALEHFLCAVKFYEARHPQHQNLARAVTNLAFVKRLLALQIKRHPIAMEIFNEYMPQPNQVERKPDHRPPVTAANLLEVPHGAITQEGFARNIEISLIYLESWLRGLGCVPIFSLMEDAATAEISRAQLWQWNRYGVETDDGVLMDTERIRTVLEEILERKQAELDPAASESPQFSRAGRLLMTFVQGPFRPFLTTKLYDEIC